MTLTNDNVALEEQSLDSHIFGALFITLTKGLSDEVQSSECVIWEALKSPPPDTLKCGNPNLCRGQEHIDVSIEIVEMAGYSFRSI